MSALAALLVYISRNRGDVFEGVREHAYYLLRQVVEVDDDRRERIAQFIGPDPGREPLFNRSSLREILREVGSNAQSHSPDATAAAQ